MLAAFFIFGLPPITEATVPKQQQQYLTIEQQRVLSLREWAQLNAISFGTAKRLFLQGKGPRTIQLSAKRVGVRMIDNFEWQQARLRD